MEINRRSEIKRKIWEKSEAVLLALEKLFLRCKVFPRQWPTISSY